MNEIIVIIPGPLAPPDTRRPRRNMTARSYSCTTLKQRQSENGNVNTMRITESPINMNPQKPMPCFPATTINHMVSHANAPGYFVRRFTSVYLWTVARDVALDLNILPSVGTQFDKWTSIIEIMYLNYSYVYATVPIILFLR